MIRCIGSYLTGLSQNTAAMALSGFEAMQKSPDRAMQKFAKFLFGQGDAAGAVQHDVTVYVSPQRKRDFPDIVFFQNASLHFGRKQVCNGIQRGRTTSPKIFRELTRSRTRTGKNEVEDARLHKSVIDVACHDRKKAVFDVPIQWVYLHVREQLGKFAVRDGVEQSFAGREVMIDSHRRDAHGFGHTAHGDGFGPFLLENGERRGSDAIGSIMSSHDLYSV